MPQTMAQLTPLLKEVYEGSLNKQLNDDTLAYTRLKSTAKGTGTTRSGGKYVEFAIHTGRNNGIGARSEMEALPEAGSQKYMDGRLNLKFQYGAIELSGQTFELANENYQVFADAVEEEVNRIKIDLAKDRNRQYFGDGSGTVATVVSFAGQKIIFDSIQHIQDDMLLDIVVKATGVSHGTKVLVTAVNEDTNEVTFSGTLTGVIAGDIAVRNGSWNREWTGLGAIIGDTNTLYEINPATTRVWKSSIKSGVGNITEVVMKRMSDSIVRKGGKTSVIWTTDGVERAYWQMLAAQRQIVSMKDFAGGYTGLEFNAGSAGKLPMLTDIDAPKGTMSFVNENEIKLYRPHEFKFMDRDGGGMWNKKVTAAGTFDAYVARMYEYSEMGTSRRNTHGRLSGITEDAAI